MTQLQQVIAELTLHLLHEYPADQWLMTDPATYAFFKERALKKKLLQAKSNPPPPLQAILTSLSVDQPLPVVSKAPAYAPSPASQPVGARHSTPSALNTAAAKTAPPLTKPPLNNTETPKPQPMQRSFQLSGPPAPILNTTDPDALKSLLAQVAPKLVLRSAPASKEELVVLPQVLILCPANTPASHRTVLENLCKAISRTWLPCEVVDPLLPATQELLARPLKLVVAEGTLESDLPFLSIPSIAALLVNPQEKIALWKELTARLAS